MKATLLERLRGAIADVRDAAEELAALEVDKYGSESTQPGDMRDAADTWEAAMPILEAVLALRKNLDHYYEWHNSQVDYRLCVACGGEFPDHANGCTAVALDLALKRCS